MERLRKSFRRKKQKDIQEFGVEEDMERDDLESKSVFVKDPASDTEDDEEAKSEVLEPPPPSRLQRLRKSIRFSRSRKKKGNMNEETELSDVAEEEVAEEEGLELEKKKHTKMSKLRSSLRIKKKDKDKLADKNVIKKEKSEKKSSKWQTDDEKVRSNHCEFKVKYLGSVEVQESRGMEVCESAIKDLKTKSTKASTKKLRAILHVSGDGLRVVDRKTQGMLVDQVIEKVSFCAPDRNFTKGFAYISRDGTSRRWVCHGFLARRDSGERLSHAVGVAFAVCLERKQTRECEGVSGSWDEDSGAFTRFGSFRQGTLTERLADPQEFKVTPLKVELGLSKEENPFAISRPRAGELSIRSSLRAPTSGFSNGGAPALPPPPGALASIRGQSPFKRGAEQYSSLRPQDLPSNIQRREKSRVSLILEETFENEETKNEINAMIILMSEKTNLAATPEPVSETSSSAPAVPPASPPPSDNSLDNSSGMVVSLQLNNNDSGFKLSDTGEAGDTGPNPWDLVPDQPRLKGHSRNSSTTNPADRWLASLTQKVGDTTPGPEVQHCPDPLEEEWAALANRNTGKAQQTNPFRACV